MNPPDNGDDNGLPPAEPNTVRLARRRHGRGHRASLGRPLYLAIGFAVLGATILAGTIGLVVLADEPAPQNENIAAATPSPTPQPSSAPASPTGSPAATPTSPLASPRRSSLRPSTGNAPARWPGSTNTGVPAGVKLRPSGTVTVRKSGTVIDRLDVNGCINVEASRVTIKRTRVRGSCSSGTISTPESTNPANVIIQDVEVDGRNQSTNNPGIAYSGFTCLRCNIHGAGTGIRMGKAVRVEDSWLHGSNGGPGSHNAAMAGHGTNNLVLRHSWLECLPPANCSSALSLYSDDAEIHSILIEGNHFRGGSYCVYGGSPDQGVGYDIKFRSNVFSREPYEKCGEYGPVTQFRVDRGNEWTGNRWDDSDQDTVPLT